MVFHGGVESIMAIGCRVAGMAMMAEPTRTAGENEREIAIMEGRRRECKGDCDHVREERM